MVRVSGDDSPVKQTSVSAVLPCELVFLEILRTMNLRILSCMLDSESCSLIQGVYTCVKVLYQFI